LAAAKKSAKELDAVARDLQGLEKKLKEDAKVKDFLSESQEKPRSGAARRRATGDGRREQASAEGRRTQ
jgi:hypothetical protein